MMGPLIADVGDAAGRTLVATHIDSWENGSQNWTARMREEFRHRCGYDLFPFLPVFSGRVVQSLEVSERFLWDLRQTISDLVVENYAGHMARLANQHGLRLSIEAYGGPCDDVTYGGRADEPMCEFWIGGGAFETCKGMASSAHTYGKRIMGAEAFTANSSERWLQHPGAIKALGDRAFCDGVNRFVFHRYAMQPWLDRRPGMSMGPWGLHYERTQTWWEQSRPWHEYLWRCQFLLRQGLFVADICHLQPEGSPQGFHAYSRSGYDYDSCTAEVVLTRMSVKDGRIVLPDGMSYRVLALPQSTTMTPPLLRKVKELVEAGATVVGPRPQKSPSLAGYPACDEDVKRTADELWGDCDGQAVKERPFGKGRIVCGLTPEETLAKMGVRPDFAAPPTVRWIHRRLDDADIYFVASVAPQSVETLCTFRVAGRPAFWQPETGLIERVPAYEQTDGVTRIPIRFEPAGSVFVVFGRGAEPFDPVVSVTRDDRQILPAPEQRTRLVIEKATYGVLSDPSRTRDVRAKLQAVVDGGELTFRVARMAEGDDPAFGIVKTLIVEYTADGESFKATGRDPEEITLFTSAGAERVFDLRHAPDGRLWLDAWQGGRYELKTASGRTLRGNAAAIPQPLEIAGPWALTFPPGGGAEEHVTLAKLISWSEHGSAGVRHFSGTATYRREFDVPAAMLGGTRSVHLDLGAVRVVAHVTLNGSDLGILWKPPYRVDVSEVVKPGRNALEVKVTNLWVNRMIGDESLPEDSSRNANGTLKQWPDWLSQGKPSPTGRHTFTSWRLWKAGDPLQESGLIGPVTLQVAERLRLE